MHHSRPIHNFIQKFIAASELNNLLKFYILKVKKLESQRNKNMKSGIP